MTFLFYFIKNAKGVALCVFWFFSMIHFVIPSKTFLLTLLSFRAKPRNLVETNSF